MKCKQYKHDFLSYWTMDDEENRFCAFAPELREIEKLSSKAGKLEEFEDYVEYEGYLWEQHEQALRTVDADTSFQADEEEPASWKREAEKHRLEKEFGAVIHLYRDKFIESLQPARDGAIA